MKFSVEHAVPGTFQQSPPIGQPGSGVPQSVLTLPAPKNADRNLRLAGSGRAHLLESLPWDEDDTLVVQSNIDWRAPIRWVPREKVTAYFDSLDEINRKGEPRMRLAFPRDRIGRL